MSLNYFVILLLGIFITEFYSVSSYISKATIESVTPNKMLIPIIRSAKISRLFLVKKLNSSVPTTIYKKPEALIQEQTPSGVLSSRFQNPENPDIYNPSSNPSISSETWKDINSNLSDEEMKDFLTTLPLHTLRNLTILTRKNPEKGQKQLIRMILDQSNRVKLKPSQVSNQKLKNVKYDETEDSNFIEEKNNIKTEHPIYKIPSISGANSIPHEDSILKTDFKDDTDSSYQTINDKAILDQMRLNSIHPSNSFSTSTTNFPVLDLPNNVFTQSTLSQILIRTTPSTPFVKVERRDTVSQPSLSIESSSLVNQDVKMNPQEQNNDNIKIVPLDSSSSKKQESSDSSRQFNSFNINSGYYIPSLTNSFSSEEDHFIPTNDSDDTQFSWHYQPQDPENTFNPNIDTFMQPPLVMEDELEPQQNFLSSNNLTTSSVWVPKTGQIDSQKDQKQITHPFSGFNSEIKLTHEASNNHQEQEHKIEYDSFSNSNRPMEEDMHQGYNLRFKNPNPNPNYNYVKSTAHPEPPQNKYKVINSHPYYEQNIDYKNPSPSVNEENKIPQSLHHQHQNFPVSQYDPENLLLYNNAGFGGGSGWGDQPGYSFWESAKSYFYKGNKSTAEKVFEISIGVLSFMAFGGYLLMLIYQVFVATASLPMFPLNTVPVNPTLLSILLGRGLTQRTYNFSFPGEKIAENYINELEIIVKKAMSKVKESLGSPKESNVNLKVNLKGDMGH